MKVIVYYKIGRKEKVPMFDSQNNKKKFCDTKFEECKSTKCRQHSKKERWFLLFKNSKKNLMKFKERNKRETRRWGKWWGDRQCIESKRTTAAKRLQLTDFSKESSVAELIQSTQIGRDSYGRGMLTIFNYWILLSKISSKGSNDFLCG